VITAEEFDDQELIARRREDHNRIGQILVARVPEEDKELLKVERPGDRTLLDRLLTPFNQAGTKRFLREARQKVWRNAPLMNQVRRTGPDARAARVRGWSGSPKPAWPTCGRRGQVLLRLAVRGVGVGLQP
jgi:hypothetical protein